MIRRFVTREIDQWIKQGLLEKDMRAKLMADYDKRHQGFSLSGVLLVLAAVLFGAAVIAFVAANWGYIPRFIRVGMIFGLILCGLCVAVVALRRNAKWSAEAALVFTLLVFGAGLALVGQMYHLSGDEVSFMLTWTLAAVVVALVFSSSSISIFAALLGLGYFWM